jgi:hypothetical protein
MQHQSTPVYPKPPISKSQDTKGFLPSIPDVRFPEVRTFDNVVSKELHDELWNYLMDQSWHQLWMPIPGDLQIYKPSNWDMGWINAASIHRTLSQPRCLFGSDEASIKRDHDPVWRLWLEVNQALNNEYEIAGIPENMHLDSEVPPTIDPKLVQGWRVYANASMHDLIQLGGYVHRDNKNLLDEDTVTILWVANQEWYPSWGGEILFYPEDHASESQDVQQFNAIEHSQQRRGFRVGWPDEGKTVCLRPNRLVVYDGRTLHSTNPTRHRYDSMPSRRVVFRARKKKQAK